jgi:hypothetical protein
MKVIRTKECRQQNQSSWSLVRIRQFRYVPVSVCCEVTGIVLVKLNVLMTEHHSISV